MVLTAVRWRAVLVGFGLGLLAVAASSLVLWLFLSALGVEGATAAATALGTVSGFGVAGWLAGRRAPFSPWFHGALSALGIALVVVVTAVRGGSPAPTGQVLLLAGLAIVVGALGGTLGAHSAPEDR